MLRRTFHTESKTRLFHELIRLRRRIFRTRFPTHSFCEVACARA